MSVALLTDSHGEGLVRVTVNYAGESPLLLPFAFITGWRISRYRLHLFLAEPGGQHRFVFDQGVPIRGRFDPLVIPMAPNASYTVELPFAKWRDSQSDRIRVQTLLRLQGQLWVELDSAHILTTALPSVPCPLYGYPNPNAITCWQGKLTSNKILLPK